VIEPDTRRCAAKNVEKLRKTVPDLAHVALDYAAIASRNRQILQRHALAVEHAEDVMVRRDEQRRRIAEWLIVREPLRVGVPVRAHDRQVFHRCIEPTREVALRGIGREEAIGMEFKRQGHDRIDRSVFRYASFRERVTTIWTK